MLQKNSFIQNCTKNHYIHVTIETCVPPNCANPPPGQSRVIVAGPGLIIDEVSTAAPAS